MIKLGFTGDILSYPKQNERILRKFGSYDYTMVFQDVKSLFSDCDYVCGSLETPISSEHEYSKNEIVFNTPESFLVALRGIGIQMLSTANNHCVDRGISGLFNTINAINREGLEYTGTRKSLTEKNYLIKTIKGVRIAFVAFTYDTNADVNNCSLDDSNDYVVNLTKKQWIPTASKTQNPKVIIRSILKWLLGVVRPNVVQLSSKSVVDCVSKTNINDPINNRYIENLQKTIKCAKSESDLVVFLLHSGGQFNSEIGEYTQYLIDVISKCGADVIVCNHTHCVLPVIKEKNQVLAYALGNFSFTPHEGYYIEGVYADYSIVLFLTINDSEFLTVSFSVVKNITGNDGISRVVKVFDLYNTLTDSKEKERLLKDTMEVLKRAGYEGDQVLQQEYFIK